MTPKITLVWPICCRAANSSHLSEQRWRSSRNLALLGFYHHQCIAVYCSVLQCVVVLQCNPACTVEICCRWLSIIQSVCYSIMLVCCNLLKCIVVCFNALQCFVVCCRVTLRNLSSLALTHLISVLVLHCEFPAPCKMLLCKIQKLAIIVVLSPLSGQCVTVCCSMLQRVAVWCNVLQYVVVYYSVGFSLVLHCCCHALPAYAWRARNRFDFELFFCRRHATTGKSLFQGKNNTQHVLTLTLLRLQHMHTRRKHTTPKKYHLAHVFYNQISFWVHYLISVLQRVAEHCSVTVSVLQCTGFRDMPSLVLHYCCHALPAYAWRAQNRFDFELFFCHRHATTKKSLSQFKNNTQHVLTLTLLRLQHMHTRGKLTTTKNYYLALAHVFYFYHSNGMWFCASHCFCQKSASHPCLCQYKSSSYFYMSQISRQTCNQKNLNAVGRWRLSGGQGEHELCRLWGMVEGVVMQGGG